LENAVKFIFIDIDNTILDFDKCSRFCIEKACENFGIPFSARLTDKFFEINDKLWKEHEKQTLSTEKLYEIRFNLIFSELNVDCDGVGFEKIYRYYLNRSAIPVDGATDALEYLSGKYKLYAASNAAYEQQIFRLEAADMLKFLSGVFLSGNIGYPKPSKEFFDACFEKIPEAAPENTLMLGDSISADIDGAVKYGLKTCWLNRKGESVPQNLKIDYVINDMAQVKDIL